MSGFAYATLISHDSELLPVFILAQSLRKYGCQFPFVVLYTPSAVSAVAREALELEASYLTFNLEPVDGSSLPLNDLEGSSQPPIFAGRLNVFSSPLWKYEMICYLSPNSLMVSHGMDLVFSEASLPTSAWLAATYLCTCDDEKPARELTFQDSERDQECPYLRLAPRRTRSMSITVAAMANDRPRGSLPDPGMFVFYPGEQLWDQISGLLLQNGSRAEAQTCGREIMADVFRGRWMPLRWSYYASDAMLSIHHEFLKALAVICIRYRIEGDWIRQKERAVDPLETSSQARQWWNTIFDEWQGARKGTDMGEKLLQIIEQQYSG